MASSPKNESDTGVRFSSVNQEIEPSASLEHADTSEVDPRDRSDVPPEVQQELRDLSLNMQKSRLQEKRMANFAFEPVSLPASRAASPAPSRHGSMAQGSNRTSPIVTPPLTPATSQGKDGKLKRGHGSAPNMAKQYPNAQVLTPQMSPPHATPQPSTSTSRPSSAATDQSKPMPDTSGVRDYMEQRHNRSAPHSRHASPSRKSSQPPPSEASTKRLPPDASKAANGTARDRGRHQSVPSSEPSSKQTTSSQSSEHKAHNRKSGLFSGFYHTGPPEEEKDRKHSSVSDLKRFFKLGGHKHKDGKTEASSRKTSRSGISTPPHHRESVPALPFADDHGLESKWGKFGKVLGSGAGGSVRLMKRSSDGTTFAVKEFRPRHAYESERDYNKKVTAEFCVGSTLHHGNVIETMDIVHEKGSWYEVMEYAPYDLFACVMTGKMSRDEVFCCVKQIMNGVQYLHSMGLAHRDLKLDNVVVNDKGIMKLIDFGSAVVFKYPFEDGVVKASGIVGSDPYLAPEVYDDNKYDPQAVDVWSLAIIFCCMSLRRFPWKVPRLSDVSYKYFVADPTPGTPSVESLRHKTSHESHHTARHPSTDASAGEAGKDPRPDTPQGKDAAPTPSIKGPWRLLRLLPRESRYMIGRMLDTNPDTRATMEDIFADSWIASKECCRQEEGGQVIRAPGHTHTLEPGAAAGPGDTPKKV